MLRAATLGAETVKRLQTFANMRADVTTGEGVVFDMSTTAGNAAEVAKPLWKSDPEKKGIKIDFQLDLEDGCLVKGQENEMFEVLVNLIRNAAEAMPQGGDIEVKAYKEADEVVITVRDTGIGIAEQDISRVFQPFWSNKGVGIGKGMGLAVSHGLVKRHGGSISVQSAVGKGTTFSIRLPLAQEQVRKTEQPATSTTEDHLTLLVIDDDFEHRRTSGKNMYESRPSRFQGSFRARGAYHIRPGACGLSFLRSRYAGHEWLGRRQGYSINLSGERSLQVPLYPADGIRWSGTGEGQDCRIRG